MKPPTNWGIVAISEKHQWHICCDGQEAQIDWMISIFTAKDIQLRLGKPKCDEHNEVDLVEERKNLKEKASIVAQCLERKEEKVQNHAKTHRSFVSVEDMGVGMADLRQRSHKPPKKAKNKTNKTTLELDNKLPSNVIQELNTVLQKNRILHDETSS